MKLHLKLHYFLEQNCCNYVPLLACCSMFAKLKVSNIIKVEDHETVDFAPNRYQSMACVGE